ncbi:MAG: hypothetical protein ACRDI2_02290 [Chloroflexota bacterium]
MRPSRWKGRLREVLPKLEQALRRPLWVSDASTWPRVPPRTRPERTHRQGGGGGRAPERIVAGGSTTG